jgi:hypothetical protein
MRMELQMTKYTSVVLLLIVVLASPAFSAKTGELELADGSVVRGEILSVNGGVYRIRTETLGEISLDESKIKNIRLEGAPGGTPEKKGIEAFTNEQVKALKDRLADDPEIMSLLAELGNDPAVQEVLKDPEIMHAVMTNDFSALLSNPKLKQILENPKIKEISKRVGE